VLTERERGVLNCIVDYYINKGEPAGSVYVASVYRENGKKLSSATIRNVFKKMENDGFIEKTHLSSGRIPTKKGLKIYLEGLIDDFKNNTLLDNFGGQSFGNFFGSDLRDTLEGFTEFLEEKTGAVALLFLPDFFTTKVKRIDFVLLSPGRVLVVVVSSNNLFREAVIKVPENVGYHDLVAASNFINMNFSGLTLFEIKKKLLKSLEDGLGQLNKLSNRVVKLAYQSLDNLYNEENGIIIKGLSNILNDDYIKEVKTLKKLIENFERKKNLYKIIEEYINSELSVNLDFPAENFSFIISSYSVPGGAKGAFGLVGPLRMNYRKNISLMRMITHSFIEQMFINN